MNRETKRIDPATLEGKTPIGCGYKIFENDWSAKGGYCYADENGEVEGSVHTVTGDLDKCGWGLHYCKNPLDCMRYRGIIRWNKFAYVEAYDENIDCDDDGKSVCRTLKIVKVLSFNEMISACKNYQGSGISSGRDINGGYDILHCAHCDGVSRCIFCFGLEGARLMLFNQPISEARYDEVRRKLEAWYPQFTNAAELREQSGGKWSATPAHRITTRTAKEAYAEMPEALRAYIKSLPEYDDEIFRAITEGE